MSMQPIEIRGSALSARVDPEGAQLRSLRPADGRELLWQGDPHVWPDQAPLLFPVIGPLVGGVLRHGGQSYPMPPHGFARLSTFEVARDGERGAVLTLRDSPATRAHYPFAFALAVSFEIAERSLRMAITATNRGDEPLPCDVGYHPGINWPLTPGRGKQDYVIEFAEPEPAPIRRGTGDPVLLYPDPRPTPVEGRVLRPRDELFEDLAIVFDRLNSRSLVFGAPGEPALRFDFPDSPHLGLWMKPGAPYLCIEPWQGYPSPLDFTGPFTEKPGVAHVVPGGTRSWRLTITVL